MNNHSTRIKNTLLNFITGSVGDTIFYLLRFLTRTVFIYTLGRSYLGIDGLFSNILTLLSLSEFGLAKALNYRLYKPLADKDETRLKALMNFYKKAYPIIGVIVLIMGIVMIPFIRYMIKDYDSLSILGINVTILFLLYLFQSVSSYWFYAYKSTIVKASQKEYYLNIASYLTTIFNSVTQIFVLVYFKNFYIYISIIIFGNIFQNLIFARIADHQFNFLKHKNTEQLSSVDFHEIFQDCKASFIYQINDVILIVTDNLVLSSFLGLEIVGLYSNYVLIYLSIRAILRKFFDSAKASIGDFFVTSENTQRYAFFKTSNLLTTILFGTATLGIIFVIDDLIEVWLGQSYLIAKPFCILLALELYTFGLKINLAQIRNVMGLFVQAKYRPLFGGIINIVISILLVKKLGIVGVIIGTLAADWLSFLLYDPWVINKYGFNDGKKTIDYYKINFIYGLELGVIGIFFFFMFKTIAFPLNWYTVIFKTIIVGLSTPIFLAIFNSRTIEFKYLKNILFKIIKHTK